MERRVFVCGVSHSHRSGLNERFRVRSESDDQDQGDTTVARGNTPAIRAKASELR